jgi:hypothetical protein
VQTKTPEWLIVPMGHGRAAQAALRVAAEGGSGGGLAGSLTEEDEGWAVLRHDGYGGGGRSSGVAGGAGGAGRQTAAQGKAAAEAATSKKQRENQVGRRIGILRIHMWYQARESGWYSKGGSVTKCLSPRAKGQGHQVRFHMRYGGLQQEVVCTALNLNSPLTTSHLCRIAVFARTTVAP